jgi:DNA polymerase V
MYSIMKGMAHGINGVKTTGFASPSQGYEETNIDLNEILIKNPSSTYLFKLDSEDMSDLGLPKGALLVVDRSKTPVFNQFALIKHEGQFLCRLMVKHNKQNIFTNGVSEITPIADETEIVGAVTASIKEYP